MKPAVIRPAPRLNRLVRPASPVAVMLPSLIWVEVTTFLPRSAFLTLPSLICIDATLFFGSLVAA